MATQSEIQARYDALLEAITSGEKRVKFADREVEYQSVADMDRALAKLEKLLAQVTGRSRKRQILVNSSKGFC